MNLEGITINVLTAELQKRLLDGKIYKIFMPNKNCMLLLIKTAPRFRSRRISAAARLIYICRRKRRNAPTRRPRFVCYYASILKKDALPKLNKAGWTA